MDAQKVDMFIMSNSKFFKSEIVPQIRERMLQLDESKWGRSTITTIQRPYHITNYFYPCWWFRY
nr:hypothetical protein [Capnocytophaga canimorsus]